ncbi:MAG: SprB repeat-containing protein, partial [Bacteroidetes bacterium]|nr:SprB repeat-containing protein [Bacteroidota bacterium]
SSIICANDCDTLTSQGGCNTVDQVEDYFLQAFSGGSVYAHLTQYGCYTSQVLVSNSSNCCASPRPEMSVAVSSVNASCFGVCDGSATVVPSGGVPPFTFQWSNGPSTADYDSLCAGIYFVTVTDSTGLSTGQSVSIICTQCFSGDFLYYCR